MREPDLDPKTTIEPRIDADEHGYRQQLQEQEEKRLGPTSVHSSVLLGLDPFRKQSASIRVHPWFQLIF